jgi:hypothetical protein
LKPPQDIAAAGFEISAADLLQIAQPAFESYVFRLAQYLMSGDSVGDNATAASFLQALIARERRTTGSVAKIYERLLPAISYVAASQARFVLGEHGRDDLAVMAAELARICGRDPDELTGENQMLDSSDDA